MEGNNIQFKLLSLNVRGIRTFDKRKCILNWLNKQNADIYFLQETYSTEELENQWRKQWRGDLFFAHGTSHSKGTLILVKQGFDCVIRGTHRDDSGTFIMLDALIQDVPFLLVNIYSPTKSAEQTQFFDKIADLIEEQMSQAEYKVIIGGDFNATFDPELDCSGGKPSIKNCVKGLENIMSTNDLIDIWRIRNPTTKRFTWRQKNPLIQRRLDFWLISNSLQDEIDKTDIVTSIKTDHSAITLDIDSISGAFRGPSFWKFNNSLLDDESYVDLITDKIPTWLDEISYNHDVRVQWDWLKYNVRKETIHYSKTKAKQRRERISWIENKLKLAEEEQAETPTVENLNKLENLKIEYEKEYEYITRGAIVRSRVNWYEKGEKNNKYFLNLENNNKTKSTIRRLELKNGVITTNPKLITDELYSFYSGLYSDENDAEVNSQPCPFLETGHIPKLSPVMQELCEGELSTNECFNVLSDFQNNKTPGNDGLTIEFYRTFWPLLGDMLVKSLNYSHRHGELSASQKQAIIVLIEKKDRDRRQIKNWRPISLVNVDVKIGSKAIAKRMEKVLPHIIHHNQNAYVKGRTIFDAVRTIDDIMSYTASKNISSLLVAIDFEKAFDSVNWNFLRRTLKKFNFGPSFIAWINAFYSDTSSCVMNNGFTTPHFKLSRGVRQGDPLSPYLFILVLEVLAIDIRNDTTIQGIKIDEQELKLIIFADDLTVFVANTESFHKLSVKLSLFAKYSGLKENKQKTEVLNLGPSNITSEELGVEQVTKAVKILGIHFTYDRVLSFKLNLETITKSIKKTLHCWSWRGLTLIGRIQIIKTFAVPKVLYRLSLIGTNKDFIKEINQILYNFVWKGKDKVKRVTLINDIDEGGLKMPHIESMIDAQRITCIQKFLDDSLSSWKYILNHYLNRVGGKVLFHCNFTLSKLPLQLPRYYRECLIAWTLLNNSNPSSLVEIANQIIWNNKYICVNDKSVFNQRLFSKGFCKVGDLFKFVHIEPRITELQLNMVDFLYLKGLYHSLLPEWKKIMTNNASEVLLKTELFNVKYSETELLSSKKTYKLLISKISKPPTAKRKFEEHYASDDFPLDWETIYSIPFECAIDTKTREFQYKVLNRILPFNDFLFKIGKIESPLCTFCHTTEENMPHLFFHCSIVRSFWHSIQPLFESYTICEIDVILGVTRPVKDSLLYNHLILLSKQYIYSCKLKNVLPTRVVFLTKVKAVFEMERRIAKERNKLSFHLKKWDKLLTREHHLKLP